jgi:hypothetical protein
VVLAAGLHSFEITWRGDVFGGAPQQSSAAAFGTLGINFRAWKANLRILTDFQEVSYGPNSIVRFRGHECSIVAPKLLPELMVATTIGG